MATNKRAAKKSVLSVDFSDVETQAVIDEGDYGVEVEDVEQKTSDNSGADYLALTFKIIDGPFKAKKLFHNCSLQPQALFNLRGVLEALGFEVPQGPMDLDPADLIGEQCGVSVAHEKYEGKTKARPVEFFPLSDLDEAEEPAKKDTAKPATPVKKKAEPDEPAAPVGKKKKKAAEPEFTVGDKVSFTDDEGNELEGEITEVDDGDFTVTTTTGTGKKAKTEEWTLELGDLTKAD